MEAEPRSVETRNNFAFLSMLVRGGERGVYEIVDAIYKEAPGNVDVVSTYALSLHMRGRTAEALRVTGALKPEQLRIPNVARYHGVFLAAADRGAEAEEYLAIGEKGMVLPEEKGLIDRARVTASGGSAAIVRKLEEAAAAANPEELPALIRRMIANGQASIASGWSAGLAPQIASRPGVRLSIAEAHSAAREWKRLRELTEPGSWGDADYLRGAYLAQALRSLQDETGAAAAWSKAVADAAGGEPAALEKLARLAAGFGWEQEREGVLWKLARKPECPRWAAESLWESSLDHGSAARLAESARLMAQADARFGRTRDSAIAGAILTRGNEGSVWQFAADLRAASRADVVLALIHALALHQQGRAKEAKELVDGLNPAALHERRSALYHAVFLIASLRAAEAADSLELADITTLPLAERGLVDRAKAAAGGKEKPGGK